MTELITPVTRSVISGPDTQAAVWFLGALSRVHLSGGQTGGAFALRDNLARRGNASPVHVHDRDDETFFVLDGELRVLMGEDDHTAGPGTVAVLPRRLRHAYVVTSATARFLSLHTPGGFEQFAAEVGRPAQALTLPPNPQDRPTSPRWRRQPPGTASPSWPRPPGPRSGQARPCHLAARQPDARSTSSLAEVSDVHARRGLQQPHRTGEPLEWQLPLLHEAHALGWDRLGHALADQHLPGAGVGGDPGGQVHGATEVVAALGDHRPGRHPHVDRWWIITPSPSHFTGTPPCSRADRPTSTARDAASAAAA